MTEERKLQLTLDEGDAKVLAGALSVLPLVINGDTLQALLQAVDDPQHRLLIIMTSALMAGAEHTATMEDEMNKTALDANMQRGAALLTKLHNWIHEGVEHDHTN